MYDVSDETQELAMAYGERLALASAIERLELLKESKKIVKNYFVLFAWEVLMREMATIVLEGWIIPDVAKGFKIAYNALIWEAAKDVDAIVSSLNTPVHAIKAPIANDYVRYNSYANFGEVVGAKL